MKEGTASDRPIFNPFDPVWRADPYPLYRRLRTEVPVGQVPGVGVWYVARYADCQAVMRDPRAGNDTRKSDVIKKMKSSGALRLPDDIREDRSFAFQDPPDHPRLRGLVASAFTPRVVEGMKPRILQLVEEAVDGALGRGRLDIVSDIAYPLSLTVICELLGVPTGDRFRFRQWSEEMVATMDPLLNGRPEDLERQAIAVRESTAYLVELIGERRRNPANNLLTALIGAEENGDRLTEQELLATAILLFGAGHETAVSLISNGMLALLRHPEQLARLRAEPALARAAVEEVLRWDPAIQMTQRVALDNLEVGGVTIPKGSLIILIIAAANRDEAHLSDGESFDIGRTPSSNLAFGSGAHFCLGAPLARAEGEIAFSTLIRRLPGLRLADSGVRRRDTLVFRGLAALPVEL
jgi:cytochrome P450